MENSLKRLVRGELIGKTIKVVDASNPSLIGKQGAIIDETKNMLVIKNDGATSKLIKDQVTITIDGTEVPGKLLEMRPEDRIKITSKRMNRTRLLVKRNARENKNKKPRIRREST